MDKKPCIGELINALAEPEITISVKEYKILVSSMVLLDVVRRMVEQADDDPISLDVPDAVLGLN